MNFYLVIDGRRQGPFPLEELVAQGLERDTLVWRAGQSDWERADKLPVLQEVLATVPPPVPPLAWIHQQRPEEIDEGERAPRSTPATFRTLHRWWMILFAATFLVPLLGGLCFLLAQTQYIPYRGGSGYLYYRYSDLGVALNVIGVLLMILTAAPLIASVALCAVLLYKMWDVIQDGRTRTTPDKAVGFLFIPFFNFYWVFVAIHGLAVDLNAYVRRHRVGMDTEPAPTGLALTFCILFCCTAVPYLQFLTFIPMYVILLLVLTRLKNAVLDILRVQHAVDNPDPDHLPAPFGSSTETAIKPE